MAKMIICLPFSYMDNYYWYRYKEQLLSLMNNCEGLFIPVIMGVYPDELNDYPNINMYIWNDLTEREKKRMKRDVRLKFWLMGFGYRIFRKYKECITFAKICSSYDYDVVLGFSGGGWMEYFHILLGKYKDVKIIHRMRGYGKLEREFLKSVSIKFIGDYLDNYAWMNYDYHIPINYEFKNVLRLSGIDESIISNPIGLGVDTDMFRPLKYDGNKMFVGYFGRISPEKNIGLLIKIMKETPDINYIVAGKMLMNVSFPDNVEYVGVLRKHELNYYYNMCKAILLPSYIEGVSNVIYETYATGKIIIASKNAINRIFPIYGYRMNGFDVKDWVKVINNLIDINFESVGMKARQWTLKNDWNSFGNNMVNTLRKVM